LANSFLVRDARESDFPFIYSTWLKGLRFGNEVFTLIEQNSYFKHYHKVIEVILHRPDTAIKVACLKDDPETILGYSILGDDMVHYVHVKQAFRGFGIGKALCPKSIGRVTHVTKVGWSILKAKHPESYYDPFL